MATHEHDDEAAAHERIDDDLAAALDELEVRFLLDPQTVLPAVPDPPA